MAITVNHLDTNASTTNASSYTTGSVDPTDGALVVIGLGFSVTSGTPPVPTSISGNGVTYTLVGRTDGQEIRDVFIYAAKAASYTAGAITLNIGTSCGGCYWNVMEFVGDVDPTDWIIDSNTTQADLETAAGVNQSYTNTVQADSVGYVVVGGQAQQIGTAGTGWTLVGATSVGSPSNCVMAGVSNPIAQIIDMDWTSTDTFFCAIEINYTDAAGPSNLDRLRIGDSIPSSIFIGDLTVSKVYVGDVQVWP